MRRRSSLVALSVLLGACMPTIQYRTSLSDVSGPPTTRIISSDDAVTGIVESETARIEAVPRGGVFALTVHNLTDSTMRIVWDDAAYVSPDGVASKVSHGEVRYIDVGKAQEPMVIPARSRAEVFAVPHSAIIRGGLGSPVVRDFVAFGDSAEDLEGKSIRLMLPIQVGGQTHEYTLTFHLRDIVIPECRYCTNE